MSLSINLTDQQLGGIMSAAVLETMAQADRDALIKDAIAGLLSYADSYDKRSPLQRAFHWSVEQIAREVCRKSLEENGQFLESIKALVAEAVARMLKDRDKLAEQLARVIADTIAPPGI